MLCEQPQYRRVGKNGGLYTLRTDRFKAELLSVTFRMPMTAENACLAPLMLSVLRRGTVRYPSLSEINRRLEELYGTSLWVNCYSWRGALLLGFGADLLDGAYLPEHGFDLTGSVLDLIGELLFHPLTDPDGLLRPAWVESEKELQINEIRSVRNVPAQYAKTRARQIFFSGTPAAIPIYGREEDVRAVTPERLTAFRDSFVRTLAPVCFCVGGDDPDRLADRFSELFSRSGGEAPEPASDAALLRQWRFPPYSGVRRVEEPFPAGQGHLILCFRGSVAIGDPGYPAVQVMNELLGVSPISKLFLGVREKKSLCYSVSSGYDGYRPALFINCAFSPRNRAAAEEAILEQVEAVRRGEITDEELTAAKKSLTAAYRQTGDRPSAMEAFYFNRMLAGVPGTPADCIRAIGTVTREDVVAAARSLTPDVVYFLNGAGGEEETDENL